jgi:phosphatidylserine/phosphatidylglycerophosphate/cardiolipin synthase-like enzyme
MNNLKTKFTSHSLHALLPLVAIIVLFVFFQMEPTDPFSSPVPMALVPGHWQIYFSHPQDPNTFRGGPDAALVESLDAARFSIDMAIYHLNLWSVRDALIRAHRRGVDVRLVIETVNADELEIGQLINAGIEVHEDQRPHLMHHKFVIIDRFEVWTGSMNLTLSGAYENDNNLIQFISRELAQNYFVEFEELFSADTPYPVVSLETIVIETYFSPDDGVSARILEVLRSAKSEVVLLAFTLTSDPIRNMLLELHQAGVRIRGVVDGSQSDTVGSDVHELIEAGIDLKLSGSSGLMHHKVFVIDGKTVLLGSYNFSRSAEEKNDENILFVHDPDLASVMLLEFDRIYQVARP